ncbi:hypothetical protein IMCC1989_464 [gamma proteobacterium IMCC1989]|nr:hypothetical protein IMCC1989_464 [gamma proteobacterium IMCC1989]
MIGIGEILIQARYKEYQHATDAVKAMQENGCSISYHQYKALERGKMPNKQQMIEICEFFNIKPNCWFMGECEEDEAHCDILNGLSPTMKKLAKKTLHNIAESDREIPH